MSGFIMGCSLDKLAFKSAHEALQHFGGKKHRFKMDKHLKIVAQEGYAIQIKDASRVPMTSILNYFATLGSIQTVHVENKVVGLNDSYYHSAIIYYDSEVVAKDIRKSRHAVECIPIVVSRYLVYDDPNRPETPPPPVSVIALNHESLNKEIRKFRKSERDLDGQMEALANLVQLPSLEPIMRKDLCILLQNLFRIHVNPHCEVYPVGSSANGLGFQGSALDAIAYVKNAFPEKLEEESFEKWRERCRDKEKNFVLNAGKILRDPNHKANVSDVATFLSGEPALKFLHDQTGIKVNLRFKSRMPVLTTEYLQLCCDFDPRIRTLCMVIKYWASFRYKLSGSCDGEDIGRETVMSNYALVLMIIFFLQKEEVLPAIKELQDEMIPEENEKIDFWQFGYSKQVLQPAANASKSNRRPVSRLLFKFFDFYADFKYNDLVISPYLGRHITKETFEIPRRSRSILPTYAINIESGKCSPLFVACPLVVQDPFELNNNCTSEFNSEALHIWKRMVQSAKAAFHEKKLYRIFDLQDLPSKLKLRLESMKTAPETLNPTVSEPSETAPAESVQPGTSQPADSEPTDMDAIACDESDRVFVAVCSLQENCHENYRRLLERDPERRLIDKYTVLVEIIVDHILKSVLKMDHADEIPPPNFPPFPPMPYFNGPFPPMAYPPIHCPPMGMRYPGPREMMHPFPPYPGAHDFQEEKSEEKSAEGGSEPAKKKSRKSRWEPVTEKVSEKFVDRKRLSELEYVAFYPVWAQRKLVRKTFSLYDKSLANEKTISDKLIETQFFTGQSPLPIATFKAWSHHSKVFENAICVHIMELESHNWPQIWKFFKEFLPQWTTYALLSGEIEISHL